MASRSHNRQLHEWERIQLSEQHANRVPGAVQPRDGQWGPPQQGGAGRTGVSAQVPAFKIYWANEQSKEKTERKEMSQEILTRGRGHDCRAGEKHLK